MGHFRAVPEDQVAIKFYVPLPGELFEKESVYPKFAIELQARFDTELHRLQSLDHPNIQQYLSAGQIPYNGFFRAQGVQLAKGQPVSFIVSRYIAGQRLDKYLAAPRQRFNESQLIKILEGVARGMHYLHEKSFSHGDLRLENILVDAATGQRKLLDFGLSKDFSVTIPDTTHFVTDPRRLPDAVSQVLVSNPELLRSRKALRRLFFPWLDLYHFGSVSKQVLAAAQELPSFQNLFLTLLANALNSWQLTTGPEGPVVTMSGVVGSFAHIVRLFTRLRGSPDFYNRAFLESEEVSPRRIVRTEGDVEIRESLAPFLSHPNLRRLHNLHQLALLYYVFPSAGQSRFDHLLSSLARTQQVWKALSNDPTFVFYMSESAVDKLELVSLLHDLNHFPFLHYFQEAGVQAIDSANILDTFIRADPCGSDPGGMTGDASELRAVAFEKLARDHGVTSQYLHKVLVGEQSDDSVEQIIQAIVNSGVDIDKMPIWLMTPILLACHSDSESTSMA